MELTVKQLWLALAAKVPVDGVLVANPYNRWIEIQSSLPDLPVVVVGPSDISGKMDTIKSTVFEDTCKDVPEFSQIEDKAIRQKACTSIRKDGAYIAHSLRNVDYVVRMMQEKGPVIGLVNFSSLLEFADKIHPIALNGVLPSFPAVRNGSYPIARTLYVHAKMQNVELVPGIQEFVSEFHKDKASGPDGYLIQAGLVPLDDVERQATLAHIQELFGQRR